MEPCTISQTLNDQIWLARIKVKYVAHENNGTWTLVEPLKCKKLIGFKWVIRVKENLDGSIKKYKAKLIAKSFHQKVGSIIQKHFLRL